MRRIGRNGLGIGLWAALLLGSGGAQAFGNEVVFENALPSLVWIISPEGNGANSIGSGVLIDRERGLALTAYHVVENRPDLLAFFPVRDQAGVLATDPKYYTAHAGELGAKGRIIATDPGRDLALVRLDRVPATARAMAIAAQSPRPGQDVYAIGNSGVGDGVLWRYLDGRVRQVYRKHLTYKSRQEVEARVVEMTLPFNGGDSGGPVLNAQGELVAITAASDSTEVAVDYGIAVEEIRTMVGRPSAPAAVPAAQIRNYRIDHNVVRDGRKGLVAHFSLAIDNARGLDCEVLLLICDVNGQPVRSQSPAFTQPGGFLGATLRLTPTFVQALADNVTVFVPYDAIDASLAPEVGSIGCAVDVREVAGNRWILGKPAWVTLRYDRTPNTPAPAPAPATTAASWK